jgi:hypothetical protein
MPPRAAGGRALARPSEPPAEPVEPALVDRIRAAISAFEETAAHVDALEKAKTRAEDQSRQAFAKLQQAEQVLNDLRQIEPARVAWDFALGESPERGPTEAEARAAVAFARDGHAHAKGIVEAIDSELEGLNSRLRLRRGNVLDAAANFVVESRELAALTRSLDEAWSRVRSLQFACATLGTRLSGRMPNTFLTGWQRTWPIALSDDFPGHPIDRTVAEAWVAAIDRILAGTSTALPGAPE